MDRLPDNEGSVDLRRESEIFEDHERIDNAKDTEDELALLRDTLAEDGDGIIHLAIPEYDYGFGDNPFIGMGANVRRTYAISRYLDVVFFASVHVSGYHRVRAAVAGVCRGAGADGVCAAYP